MILLAIITLSNRIPAESLDRARFLRLGFVKLKISSKRISAERKKEARFKLAGISSKKTESGILFRGKVKANSDHRPKTLSAETFPGRSAILQSERITKTHKPVGMVHRRSAETALSFSDVLPVTRQQLSRFCITAGNFALSALYEVTSVSNCTFALREIYIIVSNFANKK